MNASDLSGAIDEMKRTYSSRTWKVPLLCVIGIKCPWIFQSYAMLRLAEALEHYNELQKTPAKTK